MAPKTLCPDTGACHGHHVQCNHKQLCELLPSLCPKHKAVTTIFAREVDEVQSKLMHYRRLVWLHVCFIIRCQKIILHISSQLQPFPIFAVFFSVQQREIHFMHYLLPQLTKAMSHGYSFLVKAQGLEVLVSARQQMALLVQYKSLPRW